LAPTLKIRLSKVAVDMTLVMGTKYQVETSNDLKTWTPLGEPFVAPAEQISQEFPVEEAGRFFRLTQVP
jgi:hypothetical protein